MLDRVDRCLFEKKEWVLLYMNYIRIHAGFPFKWPSFLLPFIR